MKIMSLRTPPLNQGPQLNHLDQCRCSKFGGIQVWNNKFVLTYYGALSREEVPTQPCLAGFLMNPNQAKLTHKGFPMDLIQAEDNGIGENTY